MEKMLFCGCLTICTLFADTGIVERIVDGDTIKIENGVTCRLAYIDTPESAPNSRLKSKLDSCISNYAVDESNMLESGKKAKEFLKSILHNGDVISYTHDSTDKYGRYICDIYKENKSINLLLVSEGFAVPYVKFIKNSNTKQMYKFENENAKTFGLGIYSSDLPTMECLEATN